MNLDKKLLAAHAAGNNKLLIDLYTQASETAEEDVAKGFYLTHAYVFALEAGDDRVKDLKRRLREMRRI